MVISKLIIFHDGTCKLIIRMIILIIVITFLTHKTRIMKDSLLDKIILQALVLKVL